MAQNLPPISDDDRLAATPPSGEPSIARGPHRLAKPAALVVAGLVVGGLVGYAIGNGGGDQGATTGQQAEATATVTAPATDSTPQTTEQSVASAEPHAGGLKVGESGEVAGALEITLVSFAESSSRGGVVKYKATMEVKNLGNEEIDPFCGGSGATLIDGQGRKFEGTDVMNYDGSTNNCGDAIQPGLSEGNFVMEFKTPPDAKPSQLLLYGDYDYEDEAKSWNVQ